MGLLANRFNNFNLHPSELVLRQPIYEDKLI